ncbi:hypothetical protein [Nocardia sp. NPDC058633]|uniref:hypothetical protein n=1 Tax=Nocardia sp. NPDC058633 TaxID=3346568 RepID=UPI003666AAA9
MADEKQPGEQAEAVPGSLGPGERWLAGILGTAFGAAGGAAVFLSDNQAGSAALLILATVLLLLGVQGTALTRFGSGEHSFEMAEKRRQLGKALRQEAEVSEDPNEAVVYARAAEIVAPSPAGVRMVEGLEYEASFLRALDRLAIPYYLPSQSDSPSTDVVVVVDGIDVYVELKARAKPLSAADVRRESVRLMKMAAWDGQSRQSLLVVNHVDSPLTVSKAREMMHLRDSGTFDIVVWNGPDDDDAVRTALLRMAPYSPDND